MEEALKRATFLGYQMVPHVVAFSDACEEKLGLAEAGDSDGSSRSGYVR